MKRLLISAIVISLVGCSSAPKKGEGEIEPIRSQKMSTSFHNDMIKIETDCAWYKPFKTDCEIVSITSSATVSTFGNSSNNRTQAVTRARMQALANVAHFMNEEITSNKTTSTIAKNIEKANDRLKSHMTEGDTVSMSDTEAEKDTNFSIRENSNDTAVNLTENIRNNAQARLRGFYPIKQEVTGPQDVTVTIRWDRESDMATAAMRKKFNSN